MKLSAPVYHLKRQAKRISRSEKIPLHAALDRIAAKEGENGWSALAAKVTPTRAAKIFSQFAPGDMVLVGARPGRGKTLLSLELAIEAVKSGRRAAFFTLEYTAKDIQDRFRALGAERTYFDRLFEADCSDQINADHVIKALSAASRGTLAVIDYLQLLDQKRTNPDLETQVRALRIFARETGVIIVCISQIDRAYESSGKPMPGLGDVRLPNPLNLKLFDKACFLNDGVVRFEAAR